MKKVFALYDNEHSGVFGIYATKEQAIEARKEFEEYDDWGMYLIEKCSINKLTPDGEYQLESYKDERRDKEEQKEKENDEAYLEAHPWVKHPWTDVAEIHVAEGELIMDFASPTNARIYKEFAQVWAKNIERLAERTGLTKKKAAHDASLFGFAFSAMSTECDARDCGYDVAKFLKKAHCFWSRRKMTEEGAMRHMRIAHTIHLADEMYEQSLQIREWAESYGLQPSELLV